MISRPSGPKPVCEATSGGAVIATFFRKSARTPHAMNGSMRRIADRRAAPRARLPRGERQRDEQRQPERIQQHVDVDGQRCRRRRACAGLQRRDERQRRRRAPRSRCTRSPKRQRATRAAEELRRPQDHRREHVPHGERDRQPRDHQQHEARQRALQARVRQVAASAEATPAAGRRRRARHAPHPDQPDDQHVEHDQRLPHVEVRPFEHREVPLPDVEQADHAHDVEQLDRHHADERCRTPCAATAPGTRGSRRTAPAWPRRRCSPPRSTPRSRWRRCG